MCGLYAFLICMWMVWQRKEWKVPCESEESLKRLAERSGWVCKRRGSKVKVVKNKVMVVGEESAVYNHE